MSKSLRKNETQRHNSLYGDELVEDEFTHSFKQNPKESYKMAETERKRQKNEYSARELMSLSDQIKRTRFLSTYNKRNQSKRLSPNKVNELTNRVKTMRNTGKGIKHKKKSLKKKTKKNHFKRKHKK
jgi:hypothetical protein